MSAFSKILADLDQCGCCCHGHDEHGDEAQPATSTTGEPAIEKKQMTSEEIIAQIDRELCQRRARRIQFLEQRLAEIDEIKAIEKEVQAEWRAAVTARLQECEDLKWRILAHMGAGDRRARMLKEEELLQQQQQEKEEKKEEAAMRRRCCLEAAVTEFILALVEVDFDKEVEDVYGAGTSFSRTFVADEWTGPQDI